VENKEEENSKGKKRRMLVRCPDSC